MQCSDHLCDYSRPDFDDPIVPALTIPKNAPEPLPSVANKTGERAADSLSSAIGEAETEQAAVEADISDEQVPMPIPPASELPLCPQCNNALLRPGVVWFGEALPRSTMLRVDHWIRSGDIDLILVIGTSSKVYPAAGFVHRAQNRGAKVAVINIDGGDAPSSVSLDDGWFFCGDAGVIVPEILKSDIGEIRI